MKKDFDQDELIVKKLTESLTASEEEAFQELLVSAEGFYEKFESYQDIWESAAETEVLAGRSEEERWESLTTRLDSQKEQDKKPLYALWWRYAAVLAFLMVASAAVFLYRPDPEWETISAGAGEIKEAMLPAQSVVTLNGGSSVKFDRSDWDQERKVYLQGEAFFEVIKTGAPFIVYAGDAKVEVLGTSFNIKTARDKVRIACTEGKVSVNTANGEGAGKILTEGRAVELLNSGLGEVYVVDVDRVAVWRAGELIFEDTPLAEVLTRLELFFDIKIELKKSVEKVSFTGKFTNPQPDETLKTICLSAGLKYELVDEDHVRIY